MKVFAVPALLLLVLSGCKVAGREAEGNLNTASRPNRVNFLLGARELDEDEWQPVDEQGVFGAEFSHRFSEIAWEVGVLGSADEARSGGGDVEGTLSELYGGLRYEFGDQVVRPYVGAGATFVGAKIDVENGPDDDDSTLAAYVHGGITIDVFPRAYVGLDARGVFGSDVELLGTSRDIDYAQLALVVGFGF